MVISRVLILYEPRLYSDLINELIEQLGLLDIVEITDNKSDGGNGEPDLSDDVDVVILPLDGEGEPKTSLLPETLPKAKLVAFSPDGSQFYVGSSGTGAPGKNRRNRQLLPGSSRQPVGGPLSCTL